MSGRTGPGDGPRHRLSEELYKLAARLNDLAFDPGRAAGTLDEADALHLEAVSDHLAGCALTIRAGRSGLSDCPLPSRSG